MEITPRADAYVNGGCQVTFAVENLRTSSFTPTEKSDLRVSFGDGSVEANVADIVTFHQSKDGIFMVTVMVPRQEQAGTVQASVLLAADLSVAASIEFEYKALPQLIPNTKCNCKNLGL